MVTALPSASPAPIRSVLRDVEPFKVQLKTLPMLQHPLQEIVGVEPLRDMRMEDLLQRAPVGLKLDAVRSLISGRRVLITGAGGATGEELARRRYLHVDPTNRIVAASPEADWNDRLRAVAETRDRVEHQRAADRAAFDERAQQRIRDLAADVPAVWDTPATTPRERKRILRLLLEDVTWLRQDDEITLSIRFRGGATTTLRVPVRIGAWRGRKTHPAVVARAATLLASHTDADVAALLNADGLTTGAEAPFDVAAMQWLRHRYGLSSRREHLLAAGTLTAADTAARLGITVNQVRHWRADGQLTATCCNHKEWLYDPIAQQSQWIQERAMCEDRRLATQREGRTVTSAARGAV